MGRPLESDWKTFRKRVPEWRERYLEEQNKRNAAMLVGGKKTPTERFWDTEKEMKAVTRILVNCLDGHSRSKMEMHLCLMVRHKMIREVDLEEFSGELRERILRVVEAFSG
ncbi:MAG TPA: hypothetical protein VGA63_09120 [Geopsychrobacteraceae bacterium]